jgi:cell division protein FtsL
MSDQAPQSFKKHARFDPPYHMILSAVLVVNLVIAIEFTYQLYRAGLGHWTIYAEWLILLAIAVFIPVLRIRTYPLKVQDRVIRLEERLRLQALAPSEWHAQIYKLSEDQLIGLRFASDDEVVELAKQALEHNLNRKQIKERIKDWRPDNWRI